MPQILQYVFYVVFLLSVGIVTAFYTSSAFSKNNKETVITPVPNYLNSSQNNQVTTLNVWSPNNSVLDNGLPKPKITAQSAFIYDLSTNQVLFSLSPDKHLPMASLTKIMTAIVSLENPKIDNNYLVHGSDLVGEDSMGLDADEVLTQDDLLYGLFLHSANDAAETLASNYPKGRDAFISAMNDKVRTLGLNDTHFTNPTGLEGDGNQYTTAYDLLVMTRYGLTFPTFAKIAATVEQTIPQTSSHKSYDLFNETNLLSTYPGVKGIKTGYTPEAGYCLVTYLDYDGHQIIGVILGSENRREEMKELLDYSLKTLGTIPPVHD